MARALGASRRQVSRCSAELSPEDPSAEMHQLTQQRSTDWAGGEPFGFPARGALKGFRTLGPWTRTRIILSEKTEKYEAPDVFLDRYYLLVDYRDADASRGCQLRGLPLDPLPGLPHHLLHHRVSRLQRLRSGLVVQLRVNFGRAQGFVPEDGPDLL